MALKNHKVEANSETHCSFIHEWNGIHAFRYEIHSYVIREHSNSNAQSFSVCICKFFIRKHLFVYHRDSALLSRFLHDLDYFFIGTYIYNPGQWTRQVCKEFRPPWGQSSVSIYSWCIKEINIIVPNENITLYIPIIFLLYMLVRKWVKSEEKFLFVIGIRW